MSAQFLSCCLVFLNFLCQTIDAFKQTIDKTVNGCLEKKVVYYALYSSHDHHYACLYDCRSLWERLWIVFQQVLIWLKLDEDTLFSYNDVDENFEGMSSYLIDVAIIVYIENGVMKEKMFIQQGKKKETSPKPNYTYVYCVAEDNHQNTEDLTLQFNTFKKSVSENASLRCKDFVKLFVAYKKSKFNVDDMKCVKAMYDDTFTEVLFKDIDVIEHL